ncbi:MAG: hypothetical protein M2R45_03870 [Verrucomicrobia subdivision 3 bacterium]|nr:hypothetical protein [Limisphaerales bacterium]MCS1412574.1 hypothetical protein [Limisphaerales bacterium]
MALFDRLAAFFPTSRKNCRKCDLGVDPPFTFTCFRSRYCTMRFGQSRIAQPDMLDQGNGGGQASPLLGRKGENTSQLCCVA